jgi:hypothetical protein
MGMDVYGVNNKDAYFRANVWSWAAIHNLIRNLGSDLVSKNTMIEMGSNSGAGITNADDCIKLANRMDIWMEHNAEGSEVVPEPGDKIFSMGETLKAAVAGLIVNMKSEAEAKGEEFDEAEVTLSDGAFIYKVEDDHLKEFISFLRSCGGFRVH